MSDASDGCLVIGAVFVAAFFGMLIGLRLGNDWTAAYMQRRAVEVGAAEWVVNPDNGETTFRWKEPADGK